MDAAATRRQGQGTQKAVMAAIKAIILGAGYRGRAYAEYAKARPSELEIVGVADPIQAKLISSTKYWSDWREALAAHPLAEVAIITLPDALHYEAASMAINAGYHILLEKPIATTLTKCEEIVKLAIDKSRMVMVGHILRYAPYFRHIKAIIDTKELGEVVTITHQESLGFDKMAHSFVRGSLSNDEASSPMILTKCSHDFDLFAWWIGRKCKRVVSFGSTQLFRHENRPSGAAERCVECPEEIASTCAWNAKRLYLKRDTLHYLFADSSADSMRKVVAESRYGRCVFAANNNVPDHQSVMLEFEGGATVCHMMTAFTERNLRTTRIGLTKGEIIGDGESISITRFDGGNSDLGIPEKWQIENSSRHGGGDFNLVMELLRVIRLDDEREFRRVTCEALASHTIAFAAELSRKEGGKVIEVNS